MPVACIYAYIMVEPVNDIPLFFRSLESASLSAVLAGTSLIVLRLPSIGFPPANCQMYLSKLPNSFCISRNTIAFFLAANTFRNFWDVVYKLYKIRQQADNKILSAGKIHDKYYQEKNNTSPFKPQLHFYLVVNFCFACDLIFTCF